MRLRLRLQPSIARVLVAALMTALASSAASAQSLLNFYRSAHDYDATYRAARASAIAAGARVGQARAGLLPEIGLQVGAQRNWTAETPILGMQLGGQSDTYNAAIVAKQPLYRPANGIALDQSKRSAEAAQIRLDAAGQDLTVRVAHAYFDVLADRDKLASVRALEAAVTQQLKLAKRRFDLGDATITDSREAQARFDLARAQEIAAENDLRVKQLALEQLTGLPAAHPGKPAPFDLPKLVPDNAATWVAEAQARQPATLEARAALDVARLEADKARAGHLPTVDLQASVSRTQYSGTPGISSLAMSAAPGINKSIGVVLKWPLFAGFGIEDQVQEAVALEEKARNELDHAERSAEQMTRTAFLGVQSGISHAQALQAAERSSLASLKANRLGYQVGVRISIDVLNAESQLYQTQSDLARARYDVLVGVLQLKQAAGTLDEADLAKISALVGGTETHAAPGAH